MQYKTARPSRQGGVPPRTPGLAKYKAAPGGRARGSAAGRTLMNRSRLYGKVTDDNVGK
jgi:hypothetical protein